MSVAVCAPVGNGVSEVKEGMRQVSCVTFRPAWWGSSWWWQRPRVGQLQLDALAGGAVADDTKVRALFLERRARAELSVREVDARDFGGRRLRCTIRDDAVYHLLDSIKWCAKVIAGWLLRNTAVGRPNDRAGGWVADAPQPATSGNQPTERRAQQQANVSVVQAEPCSGNEAKKRSLPPRRVGRERRPLRSAALLLCASGSCGQDRARARPPWHAPRLQGAVHVEDPLERGGRLLVVTPRVVDAIPGHDQHIFIHEVANLRLAKVRVQRRKAFCAVEAFPGAVKGIGTRLTCFTDDDEAIGAREDIAISGL
eukprot:scaffold855_cov344-Prasinococcus_capsulatus_cf.AAC.14